MSLVPCQVLLMSLCKWGRLTNLELAELCAVCLSMGTFVLLLATSFDQRHGVELLSPAWRVGVPAVLALLPLVAKAASRHRLPPR